MWDFDGLCKGFDKETDHNNHMRVNVQNLASYLTDNGPLDPALDGLSETPYCVRGQTLPPDS